MANAPEITPPQYYYAVNGLPRGPVTGKQLKQLASEGTLSRTDLVWKDGLEQGVPAGKIKGLFSDLAIPKQDSNCPQSNVEPSLAPTPGKNPAIKTPIGLGTAHTSSADQDSVEIITTGKLGPIQSIAASNDSDIANSGLLEITPTVAPPAPPNPPLAPFQSLPTGPGGGGSSKTIPAIKSKFFLFGLGIIALLVTTIGASQFLISGKRAEESGASAETAISEPVVNQESVQTSNPSKEQPEIEPAGSSPLAKKQSDENKPSSRTQRPFPDDVRTVARMISVDYVDYDSFPTLHEAGKGEVADHIAMERRRHAGLESLAARNPGTIGDLARKLISSVECLDRIYTTIAPPKKIKEFADIGRKIDSINSGLLAQAELQLEKIGYFSATQRMAPELVRWFEEHSAKTIFTADMQFSKERHIVHLVNTTTHDLSDSLIVLEFFQTSSSNTTATIYVESWQPGKEIKFSCYMADAIYAATVDFRVIGWEARSGQMTNADPWQIKGTYERLCDNVERSLKKKHFDDAKFATEKLESFLTKYPNESFQLRSEEFLQKLEALNKPIAGNTTKAKATKGTSSASASNQKADNSKPRVPKQPLSANPTLDWPDSEWWTAKRLEKREANATGVPFTKEFRAVALKNRPVRSVAFLGNGQRFATVNDSFQLWNTVTGKSTDGPPEFAGCEFVRVSPKQDKIIVGRVGSVDFFDPKGKLLVSLPLKNDGRNPRDNRKLLVLEITPDGKNLFYGGNSNDLWINDTKDWNCLDMTSDVSALNLLNGQLFIGMDNGEIERLDPGQAMVVSDPNYQSHRYPVVRFYGLDETYMLSIACQPGTGVEAAIFERKTGKAIGVHHVLAAVRSVRLDAQRRRLVCGMTNGSINVHDITQLFKVISTRAPTGSPVTAIDIHPGSGAILAGFENGEIVAFQPDSEQ